MMKTHPVLAGLLACVFLAVSVQAADRANESGRYERIRVHGPSLVGNLDGDSPDRDVSVYLPPGYAKDSGRRFPVIYLLHGFTDSDSRWFGREGRHFVHVPNALDAAFRNGVAEMIVVMPNALTRFGGSMYSNSVAVGDWETFVTRDLVAHIDAHYRTLANPASRGLAGHSMGGYGTLRLAMKAPGVFSALYVMSPCCLVPNPGMNPGMFERPARVRSDEDIARADFFTKAMLASAAAWSPDPGRPPLNIELPVKDGALVTEVLQRWAANAPAVMLHQHVPAMKQYRAIAIDTGDRDEIAVGGAKGFHELLDQYGIANDFEIYEGDHVNRIHERLTSKLMPFFARHLASQSP